MNSVFDNMGFVYGAPANAPVPSKLFFAFNTVAFDGPSSGALECVKVAGSNVSALIQNNILTVRGGSSNALKVDGRNADHNVLFPQSTVVPGTNVVADPLLADVIGHDFHVTSGSPAIDAAAPSTGLDPPVDFEGTPRPQGPRKDIGAFELKP